MSIDIVVHLPILPSSKYKTKELNLQIPNTLTILQLYAYLVQLKLVDIQKDYLLTDNANIEMKINHIVASNPESYPVIIRLKEQKGRVNFKQEYSKAFLEPQKLEKKVVFVERKEDKEESKEKRIENDEEKAVENNEEKDVEIGVENMGQKSEEMHGECSALELQLSGKTIKRKKSLQIKKITSEIIPEEKKCPCCLLF